MKVVIRRGRVPLPNGYRRALMNHRPDVTADKRIEMINPRRLRIENIRHLRLIRIQLPTINLARIMVPRLYTRSHTRQHVHEMTEVERRRTLADVRGHWNSI